MNKVLVFALGISVCLSAYVPSGYTVVPNSIGATNSTIQSALSFAKDKIVGDLAKGNYISGTNFVVSQVNSYAQQNKSTSTNFAFDAVFSNSNDTTISSNFTVSRSKAGVFTVMSYSVTISKTTPVAPNFVDVSPSEVASSQIIQTLRDYGFGQVVVQVQQKYPFIAGPFVVNKTNTVQRQVISDGRVIYKFNVEGHNDDDVKLVAAYAVSYTASTGEKLLMASTYVIVDGDTVNDLGELNSGSGYTQVSQTEASSTLTQQIRDFGIQALVDDGVEKGKIPDNTYVVKTTNGVYKQQVSTTVTNYKFDLVLVDNKGTTITGIFIVSYNTQTKVKEMVGFAYNSQKSS